MILTSILIVVAAIVITPIGLVFYRQHQKMKAEQRRCILTKSPEELPCSELTRRIYMMVPVPKKEGEKESRFGRRFYWFILDICGNGHIVIIDQGEKWFSLPKLAWRHVWDPGQFSTNQELLDRAMPLKKAVPPLEECMQVGQRQTSKRAERIIQAQKTLTITTSMPDPPAHSVSAAFRPNPRFRRDKVIDFDFRPRANKVKQ